MATQSKAKLTQNQRVNLMCAAMEMTGHKFSYGGAGLTRMDSAIKDVKHVYDWSCRELEEDNERYRTRESRGHTKGGRPV